MATVHNKRLIGAVSSGDVESVESEIQDGADVNFQNGVIITYLSPRSNSPSYKEILRILLEAGANPNQIDRNGYPILGLFAMGRSNGMVEMLLKAGANPNVSFLKYQSVLDGVMDSIRVSRNDYSYGNAKALCEVTNYDEVERLKKKYPQYEDLLNCQMSKASMAAVETALDNAAIRAYPQQTPDGVELPHVMKNVKDYVGYKNVGPGGRRRKTKKRKSSKKKTKKRK
jgi:ankyrin repeat protein